MITARDLLFQFLDLKGLSPKFADWTEVGFSNNPPRLYRLRQLVALFRAYGIPWGPESFSKGGFIKPKEPRYKSVISILAAEVRNANDEGGKPEREQLPGFFEELFKYRRRVDHVLSFSSGLMAAGGLYLHAHRKVNELNRIIKADLDIIDDSLALLISPEAATFTVEQLVREYDYPDVDLDEIDLDWW